MKEVKNYYYPTHQVFTKEMGWVKLDRLYQLYSNRDRVINILEFDIDSGEYFYNGYFTMQTTKVRSCTYKFGFDIGNPVQYNVHPDCEVMVSVDGGETLEFLTATEIHRLNLSGEEVLHMNIQTIYDIYKRSDKLRLFSNVHKVNHRYHNGIAYGIGTDMGHIISRYNGRHTILGSIRLDEGE